MPGTVSPTSRLARWADRQALFVAGLGLFAVVLLWQIPQHFNQDAWLGLVAGRAVAQDGIPSQDTLTILTAGERWIDQQWLAQLVMYAAHQAGGLALVALGHVALTSAGLALAVAAGRSLGGSERHVLAALAAVVFLFLVVSAEVRTQGLAYPLFVAVLWALAADGQARSNRVFLVFPLLVLWANLHGSVVLGVGLVGLYGLTLLWSAIRGRRDGRGREVARALALCVGAPLCLAVSPYGLEGLAYYADTLLDPPSDPSSRNGSRSRRSAARGRVLRAGARRGLDPRPQRRPCDGI